MRDQPLSRPAPVDSDTQAYSVKKGETLSQIAERHDTTVDELVRLNPELRANPNALRIGQNIDVPCADEAAAPRRAVPQDVQSASRQRHAAAEQQVMQRIGVDNYARPAPSLDEVRQGANMRRGMGGQSVTDVQRMLNRAGANPPLAEDGKFGPKTEAALREYQARKSIQQTGVLGPTTLSRLERERPADPTRPPDNGRTERNGRAGATTPIDGVRPGPLAQRIGDAAEREARRMGTVGRCALGVNNALISVGVQGRGHAYQKAEQLARDPRFREVSVSRDQLDNLPRGAVIVWGRSGAKPYGHVAVALGNGMEASDHIQRQIMGGRYGTDFGRGPDPQGRQFRVFIPVG